MTKPTTAKIDILNEKGIDVEIIIGQTAIERLAYYILVQDKKMLSSMFSWKT